jgi:hypothetical protein
MDLTQEELEVLRNLRNRGYALAIFSPLELGNVRLDSVEDEMVAAGRNTIETLKDE